MDTLLRSFLFASALMLLISCSASGATTSASSQTFVVTHTGNDGDGSLRRAIVSANAQPGPDRIIFKIEKGTPDPKTGAYTIPELRTVESGEVAPLPEITGPLSIDGYSQGGATPASENRPARLLIELSGIGLRFNRATSGSTVRGLVVNRAPSHGIFMGGASNVVEGNFIGTDVTGTQAKGNVEIGLLVDPSVGNVVRDNVVSANGIGIVLNEHGQPLGNDHIARNKIGTDVTGTKPLGNRRVGLFIWTHNNLIEDNIISFNGTADFKANGITLDNSYRNARFNTIRNNLITGNTGHGIEVRAASQGNVFSENRIFSNGGLGIDLGRDGLTFNDRNDEDEGENDLQNYPVLDSAGSEFKTGAVAIAGSLNSAPNNEYFIELFANDPGQAACVELTKPMIWLEGEAKVRNVLATNKVVFGSYTLSQARADIARPGALPVFDGMASSLVFYVRGGMTHGGSPLFQKNAAIRSLFPIPGGDPPKNMDEFLTGAQGRFVVHPDANQNGVQGETVFVTWALFPEDAAEWLVKGGPTFLPDPDSFDPDLATVYREHDALRANWPTPVYKLMRIEEGKSYDFELHHFEAGGGEGVTLAYALGDERGNTARLVPLATQEKLEAVRHRSPTCGAQAFNAAQGQQFLASFRVRTDDRGHVVFRHPIPTTIPKGSSITATAARWADGKPQSTSEFSEALPVR